MHQPRQTIQNVRKLHQEGNLPLVIRGKAFGIRELRIIHQCVEEHYVEGRTRISQVICEKLDWRQANGWLKDRACRDVLRRMDSLELIGLPPPKTSPGKKATKERVAKPLPLKYDLSTRIIEFPAEIELVFAKGNDAETVWNRIVDDYHYLGHSVSVGRTIKYLFRSGKRLLGAVSFSSAAWHLSARDNILKRLGYEPSEFRDIVINNNRFLILPNVQVSNLASRLLSLATTKIVSDWSWYYAAEPLFAETFVETTRFSGASYKAANWLEIGLTQGYAKRGSSYHNSQEPKAIYLYGLNRKTRRRLNTVVRDTQLGGK